jgi:hypothetical protein
VISAVVVIIFVCAVRNSTTQSTVTTAEMHRVAACGDVLDASGVDSASENGCCCCSIPGDFVCVLRDVLDETWEADWGNVYERLEMRPTEHRGSRAFP